VNLFQRLILTSSNLNLELKRLNDHEIMNAHEISRLGWNSRRVLVADLEAVLKYTLLGIRCEIFSTGGPLLASEESRKRSDPNRRLNFT
jgi:hypothetical protein